MQVLIVPAWLRRKLEANNLPLTVLLDTERLSSILTKEDLFFLLKANSPEENHLVSDYAAIKSDFEEYLFCDKLYSLFAAGELELLQAQCFPEGDKPNDLLIYGDVLNMGDVETRAFNLHNYETTMLQPDVAAVIVKPCVSAGYTTASLKSFLEVLQGQMGYEQVAKLNSFKRFVEKV
tara:strand:+ start:146756 stop:147289 length:534 start_codon:yes stop_codon:yes gene_type:complete